MAKSAKSTWDASIGQSACPVYIVWGEVFLISKYKLKNDCWEWELDRPGSRIIRHVHLKNYIKPSLYSLRDDW